MTAVGLVAIASLAQVVATAPIPFLSVEAWIAVVASPATPVVSAPDPPGLPVVGTVVAALLEPVVGLAVGLANPGHPKFAASPNACYLANLSSFAALAGTVIVDGSMGAPANDDPGSHPSSPRVSLGKMRVRFDNSSSLNHSSVTDTNGPPRDATTSHHKNRFLHPRQEQRRHTYPAALSTPAVRRIQ